jgi:hypothetical protein
MARFGEVVVITGYPEDWDHWPLPLPLEDVRESRG